MKHVNTNVHCVMHILTKYGVFKIYVTGYIRETLKINKHDEGVLISFSDNASNGRNIPFSIDRKKTAKV